MSRKRYWQFGWFTFLSTLLVALFLFIQTLPLQATSDKAGSTLTHLPLVVNPVTMKGATQITEITLPHPLAAATGSWCTWSGCLIGPPLYHAPLADGRTLVGWTDNSGNGHASFISDSTIQTTINFSGREVRGLYAHNDNSFAVLLFDPTTDIMWLSRRASNGSETWATNLNNPGNIPDFWLGDGRLTYGNGQYLAYYTITGGGHYGDQLTYVNDSGAVQTGGWGWGCSHSMAQLVSYHPGLDDFIAVCSSDCYASKGILINDNQRIYEADGNCGGLVSAQLGQLALSTNSWKLVFNAVDRPCCNGQGIAFATIQANLQSSYVWLTQTDGSTERDPVMARLGTGGGPERYLVGWLTTNNNAYHLAVVDGSGNFIFPAEEVSSASIRWGNRDDSFRTRADGTISWVQGDAESTQLRLYTFDGGSFLTQLPIADEE
jgi:hypothetical protein